MITHPKNLSWKLLQYNDYKIPLIASDLDRMNGLEVSEGVPGTVTWLPKFNVFNRNCLTKARAEC